MIASKLSAIASCTASLMPIALPRQNLKRLFAKAQRIGKEVGMAKACALAGLTLEGEARASWVKNLDAMAARKPVTVIPGHMVPGAAIDVSALTFTRNYLLAFEEELVKAANSADLITAMTKRYPDLGMGIALQIGAKVAKGEMKWG